MDVHNEFRYGRFQDRLCGHRSAVPLESRQANPIKYGELVANYELDVEEGAAFPTQIGQGLASIP